MQDLRGEGATAGQSLAEVMKNSLDAHPELPLPMGEVMLLVGGGEVDLQLLKALGARGWRIVAADGGAHACVEVGLTPDAIIGDFDSLNPAMNWPASTKLVCLSEQETTDFEKCLYGTWSSVVVALGISGGRLDHSLSAFDVLARHAHKRPIILVDGVDAALALHGDVKLHLPKDARVSVHPLKPVRFVRSRGLKYPLDGLSLALGERTATSNLTTANDIFLESSSDRSGSYMIVVGKVHLDALVAAAGGPAWRD